MAVYRVILPGIELGSHYVMYILYGVVVVVVVVVVDDDDDEHSPVPITLMTMI